MQVGQEIKVDIFKPGDKISVTGVSKGKGFAGVMKRWHFHGGPQTHGSTVHRKPQSGGATDAARTFKGWRKPGHMGNVRVTVKGLQVEMVDTEKGVIALHGSVPGPIGSLVMVTRRAPVGKQAKEGE